MAQAEAQFVYRLQTVGGFGGKSDQLNAYNVFLGEPDFFARDLERYLAATPAVTRRRRVPLPGVRRRASRSASFRAVRSAWRSPTRCRPPFTDVTDRTRLPALAEDVPFTFPAIRKASLPNGLAIWTVQHRNIPVQTMVLLVRVGSSEDPGRSAGPRLAHGRHARRGRRRSRRARAERSAGPARGAVRHRGWSRRHVSHAHDAVPIQPSRLRARCRTSSRGRDFRHTSSIACGSCARTACGSFATCRQRSPIARLRRRCTARTRTGISRSARWTRSRP